MANLTSDVLALYGRKGYDAPIMKAGIVRYALCCKNDAARTFVAERRRTDPTLVKEVEESLRFER